MDELNAEQSAPRGITSRPLILVALVSAIFFATALVASLQKSPAYDEPFHIATGLLYVESGRVVRTSDHTPLARELSGLALHAAGVRLPQAPDTAAVLAGQGAGLEYPIGNAVIALQGANRVMFWARLPHLLLGAAFIWSVFLFGRAIVGQTAGVCAALLCAFDPLVVSNFSIVYTDAGLALFAALTVFALWRYVQQPTWWRIVWCGLALGAALGTKYSAVALLPVVALLLLSARIWPVAAQRSGLVPSEKGPLHANYFVAFLAICAVAASLLLYIFLWPGDPLFYWAGLRQVTHNHNAAYLYYLGGQYAKHFNMYYVEAWLLKEPLAVVLSTAVGVYALARCVSVSRLACFFLVLPAAFLLAGYSFFSDDLGVRYLLPVLPFSMVAAGAGLAALWGGKRWMRAASVLLCVWCVAAWAGVYPDHMNYFNESACMLSDPSRLGLAGGTACGAEWLDDSNIDSGQGLKELGAWLEKNSGSKRVYVGYFGVFPTDVYGVTVHNGDYDAVLRGTAPGLYAVSAQIVARAHPGAASNGAAWLLTAKPIAFVGHTYFIYEIA